MNLLDLYAKLTFDSEEYERGISEAENKASDFGSRLKSGLATAAKVGAAAIGVAASGIAALTKKSIDGYAQYEQLIGGVETLFKTSSTVVEAYANRAYRTAGLSANEYMETVTSFSASLLQSLEGDTTKAAYYADMAITDMADNANKMGTSMDSIQNAYQGFAKQNYTMLDNLKLGYGGTKEEMQRLLDDAGKLAGVKFDLSSYADIVQAIHIVQEEMGIAGTTAKEASETISGSFSALKAAWQNLVTGLAGGGDMSKLVGNLTNSFVTFADNILPVAATALAGVGALVEGLAPVLAEQLPTLLSTALPPLLSAGTSLILAVVKGISGALPSIIPAAFDAVLTLATGLIDALPELLPAAVQLITDFALMLVEPDNLQTILTAALDLLVSLAEGLMDAIPKLVDAAIQVVNGLVTFLLEPGNIAMLINAAIRIVIAIAAGLISAIPQLISGAIELIESLIGQFEDTDWGEVGSKLVDGIIDGLKAAWSRLTSWGKTAWNKFVSIFSWPSDHDYNVPQPNVPGAGTTDTTQTGLLVKPNVGGTTAISSSGSSYYYATAKRSVAEEQTQALSGLTGAVLAQNGNGGTFEIVVKIGNEMELARVLFDPLKIIARQRGEALA